MLFSSPLKRGHGEEENNDGRDEKGNSAGSAVREAKGLSVDIKDLCEKAMLKIVEKVERVNEGNRVATY